MQHVYSWNPKKEEGWHRGDGVLLQCPKGVERDTLSYNGPGFILNPLRYQCSTVRLKVKSRAVYTEGLDPLKKY